MLKGAYVKLIDDVISVGDKAPVSTVAEINLNDEDVGGVKDKIQLILSTPSLDTDTCVAEIRRFSQDVDNLDIYETAHKKKREMECKMKISDRELFYICIGCQHLG